MLILISLSIILLTGVSGEGTQAQMKLVPKPSLVVSSEDLRAILAAERAFQANANIPQDKKDLGNYHLEIFKTETTIQVMFAHKILPEEREMSGGSGKLGVTVSFFVDRRSWTIQRVLFYK